MELPEDECLSFLIGVIIRVIFTLLLRVDVHICRDNKRQVTDSSFQIFY